MEDLLLIRWSMVLRYGNLGDGEVDEGVARLAAAVTQLRANRNRAPN